MLESITSLKRECDWAGVEPPEFITQMHDALTELMNSMDGPEPNFALGTVLVHMINHLTVTNDIPAVTQVVCRRIADERF